MPDAVLLQIASGGIYADMLRASRPRHKAYCREHGFLYWDICGIPMPDVALQWQKFVYILRAFECGCEYVAYLDADSLIVDTGADLRDALTARPLGMVWGQVPGGEPEHFNVGVIYVRRAARSAAALRQMLRRMPQDPPLETGGWWTRQYCEQRILNDLLREPAWADVAERVDRRWNCLPDYQDAAGAVVLAWHGRPTAQEKLAGVLAYA